MTSLDVGCGYRKSDCDVRLDIVRTKQTNIVGDIRKLPFKDESFNFIRCVAVLEHLHEDESYNVFDQTKALKECFRVLKKDGKAYFSVPNGWQMAQYDHKSNHAVRDWMMLIEKAGFKTFGIRGTAISNFDGTNKYLNAIFRYFSRHPWLVGFNSEFSIWVRK